MDKDTLTTCIILGAAVPITLLVSELLLYMQSH